MKKWWRDFIRKQFVKSFDEYGTLMKEENLKRFVWHNFKGFHVSRNPKKVKSWIGEGGDE